MQTDEDILTKCNCDNSICKQNQKLANRFLKRQEKTRKTSLAYYYRVVKRKQSNACLSEENKKSI